MDHAEEVRRVLTGLRFSREWEPRLVLQVLDATPDTAVRMWALFWLSKFGHCEARTAFLDLVRTCPREWFAELNALEPAERLIFVLSTMEIASAPPPSSAGREAMLALVEKCEAIIDRRLDQLVEEEERQGWEYSTDQILLRLDGKPFPRVLNLWEGTPL